MLLAPAASAAVVKPAVPRLSAAVSSTLPLLTSVKVTEPDAVPLLALTCAVKVTQESWVTDVAEAVSVVLVASAACGTAAAPAVPGRATAPVPASKKAAETTRAQRIPAASPEGEAQRNAIYKRSIEPRQLPARHGPALNSERVCDECLQASPRRGRRAVIGHPPPAANLRSTDRRPANPHPRRLSVRTEPAVEGAAQDELTATRPSRAYHAARLAGPYGLSRDVPVAAGHSTVRACAEVVVLRAPGPADRSSTGSAYSAGVLAIAHARLLRSRCVAERPTPAGGSNRRPREPVRPYPEPRAGAQRTLRHVATAGLPYGPRHLPRE